MFPCPSESELRRTLLSGPPAEVERLADHVEQCPRCGGVLGRSDGGDVVAALLRERPAGGEEENVRRLIESVRKLRGRGADGGDVATRVPRPEPRVNFLDPPEGPGEIGRLGGYRVLRLLGSGGMGVVFEAEDPSLRRPVALKAVRPEYAADGEYRERFLREARAAAAVTHDHIIGVYQVGVAGGVPFMAMPLLRGRSLQQWVASGKRLSVGQACRIAREAAKGLAAAHAAGLVHRDIKPANLWLEAPNGRVKILDFGLARPVGPGDHLTASGMVMGTPAYMALEQARGHALDGRADLYALGVVLYQLLAGRLPFQGPDPVALLAAMLTETPPPLRSLNPRVPAELEALVGELLSREPAGRPATAAVVADRLLEVERQLRRTGDTSPVPPPAPAGAGYEVVGTGAVETAPVSAAAEPTRRTAKKARKRRRNPWPLVFVGVLAAAALVASVVALTSGGKRTGTLTVFTPGPPVPVLVLRGGETVATVLASVGGGTVELPPGEYTLKPDSSNQDHDHLDARVDGTTAGAFTLKRGQSVRASLFEARPRQQRPEPERFPEGDPPPKNPPPDHHRPPPPPDWRPGDPWPPPKGPPPKGPFPKGPPPKGAFPKGPPPKGPPA